jgi:transcription initiation factor TFIIB
MQPAAKQGSRAPLNEIEEVVQCIPQGESGRSYRFISFQLQLELAPTNPVSYIPRFASKLGLSPRVQRRAVEILQLAFKAGLTFGKGPHGNVRLPRCTISSIQEGSGARRRRWPKSPRSPKVTVRNRYKEFEKKLGLQVDV